MDRWLAIEAIQGAIDREKAHEPNDGIIGMSFEIAEGLIKLLKDFGQPPRVMTLEEVRKADTVFLEYQGFTWKGVVHPKKGEVIFTDWTGNRYFEDEEYGDTWRCWNERPTLKQMEEAGENAGDR